MALPHSAGAAGAVVQWDQRNDGLVGLNSAITGYAAQPFTPALSALDTVEMCFDSEAGGDISVDIVDTQGATLASSIPVTITESPAPWPASLLPFVRATFTFSTPVTLSPGQQYVIQTRSISGHAYAVGVLDPNNLPFGVTGFWFREGLSGDPNPMNATSYVFTPTC